MEKAPTFYRLAAFFVLISAVLHLLAFTVGGVGTVPLLLIPVGVLYLLIAAGLNRGKRWLAWIAFFVMGIGGSVALALSFGAGPVPGWWYLGITAADWCAALLLFAGLWRAADPVPNMP